jgi:hypothetical protein
MDKKIKDAVLNRRFNSKDMADWQEAANKTTGGNLTLWIELNLNESAKKQLATTKVKGK